MSGEFLRFLSTGGFAAVVNLLSRHELSKAVSFEIAVVLSYLLGMLTAYVLARQFVFQTSGRSVVSELKRFAIVNVFLVGARVVDQHRPCAPSVPGDRFRLACRGYRPLHRRRGPRGGELFRSQSLHVRQSGCDPSRGDEAGSGPVGQLNLNAAAHSL